MSFQPQEQWLKDVLVLLKLSMAPDTETQRAVHTQFEELSTDQEFCKYLMFVVSKLQDEDEAIRSRSCLNVKNIVKQYQTDIKSDVLEYIKEMALVSINDRSILVRKTVGTLISALVAVHSVKNWPQLAPCLLNILDSDDSSACSGVMTVLLNICEDTHELTDHESPLNQLIPKLFNLMTHPDTSVRLASLTCLNTFLGPSYSLMQNIDYYMCALFNITRDDDVEVCREVCIGFTKLIEQKIPNILPHMNGVMEYMISKTQDMNVAITASDFWHVIADQPICKEYVGPFLPKLVPVLVRNMKFADYELIVLKGDAEDENIEDRDEDIKPRFHRSKDEREDFSDDDEMLSGWNVRKSNAAALDTFAHIFKEDLLPIILPILNETLLHDDWVIKESGILALGAISEGCMHGIAPHLNELMPYLIQCVNYKKSLIRVITCWTLSRYYEWVVSNPNVTFLEQILSGLLQQMLDTNKKVQESACSALAKLEEVAGMKLLPHLEMILKTFVYAFSKYQRKNLTLLYDAVGTLANYVGPYLNTSDYINLLMPSLIDKWNKTNDDDKHIFCLFECITCVAVALRQGFIPFVQPVYKRSLLLIEKSLNEQMEKEKDPKNENLPEPNVEFIICSLDLISGLIEALGSQMESLIQNSNCLNLLYQCMQNPVTEVRQSSFSLLGDMARNCFACIYPIWGNFIPIIVNNINPHYLSVCNNATWAVGEISVKLESNELKQFIDLIIKQLISVVNSGNKVLVDIAAIALGRIGNICPVEVSKVLDQFSTVWCLSAGNIRDRYEKESTFKGMCQIIMVRPESILRDLYIFCNAIATWDEPSEHLKSVFCKILHGYKTELGEENWNKVMDPFTTPVRERLSMYQI